MHTNPSTNSSPRGVALGDLMAMLAPTSIKAPLEGDSLIAQQEHYTVRVGVVPPAVRESANGPISAVVRTIADLPAPILGMFRGREPAATATFNTLAALGALYLDGQTVRIGSRLTIYEAEDVWRPVGGEAVALGRSCLGHHVVEGSVVDRAAEDSVFHHHDDTDLPPNQQVPTKGSTDIHVYVT